MFYYQKRTIIKLYQIYKEKVLTTTIKGGKLRAERGYGYKNILIKIFIVFN